MSRSGIQQGNIHNDNVDDEVKIITLPTINKNKYRYSDIKIILIASRCRLDMKHSPDGRDKIIPGNWSYQNDSRGVD